MGSYGHIERTVFMPTPTVPVRTKTGKRYKGREDVISKPAISGFVLQDTLQALTVLKK